MKEGRAVCEHQDTTQNRSIRETTCASVSLASASPLVLLRIGPRLAVRHQSLLHNTARHVKAYCHEKTVWKNLSF